MRAKKGWSRSRGSLESGNWPTDFRDLKCVIHASPTPDFVCLSPRMSRLVSLLQRIGVRSFRKPWQTSSRRRYRTYRIEMSFPITPLWCFWNMPFDVLDRATDTFGPTMQPAAAWIRNPLHRRKSSLSALLEMLLVLQTLPRSQMQYLSMSDSIRCSRLKSIWWKGPRFSRNTPWRDGEALVW